MASRPVSLEDTVAALVADTEAQRERIGRLLHDDIGQVLSGVGLQLEALRLDLKGQPELAECAGKIQGMLEHAMSQVRELSSELNPSVVERAGLQFALERLAERYRNQIPGSVRVHFPPGLRVPRPIAKAFYRVAEYAFQYAVVRASATQVEVRMKVSRELTALEVRFDGVDEVPEAAANNELRLELLKLHYHARQAGISIIVESGDEKGTIVRTSYHHSGATV